MRKPVAKVCFHFVLNFQIVNDLIGQWKSFFFFLPSTLEYRTTNKQKKTHMYIWITIERINWICYLIWSDGLIWFSFFILSLIKSNGILSNSEWKTNWHKENVNWVKFPFELKMGKDCCPPFVSLKIERINIVFFFLVDSFQITFTFHPYVGHIQYQIFLIFKEVFKLTFILK